MANNYTVQLCYGGDFTVWHDMFEGERFFLATEARVAAETLLGGDEYRLVRIKMNGEPLAWNEGIGWRDWHYAPTHQDSLQVVKPDLTTEEAR